MIESTMVTKVIKTTIAKTATLVTSNDSISFLKDTSGNLNGKPPLILITILTKKKYSRLIKQKAKSINVHNTITKAEKRHILFCNNKHTDTTMKRSMIYIYFLNTN